MPRGRRPGTNNTRDAILAAARREFGEAGYQRATIRAIAAEAGVDPALVMHFFGSKRQLFREAVGWPIDPAEVVQGILSSANDDLGQAAATAFVKLWDNDRIRHSLLAVLRSALTHEDAASLVRATFQTNLVRHIARTVGGPEAELRVELAAAQLIGMAILRHVIRLEPLASASSSTVVRRLAPALNQHFAPGPKASED